MIRKSIVIGNCNGPVGLATESYWVLGVLVYRRDVLIVR